jgi:23S rRNA (guanosine2251-2'-O)-methyltransferase
MIESAPGDGWLEGHISVEAALRGNRRTVQAVYIQEAKLVRDAGRLEKLAAAAGVPVEKVDAAFLDAHAGGRSHGGVLAKVSEPRFSSLEQLIAGPGAPMLFMLDGVEDPFNFGQAVRALYAAGADGLVVRPRNWLSAAGIAGRASAGATELLPMAAAESATAAAGFFRERGLHISCTSREKAVPVYEADLTGPMFILIGGERRGITRSFLAQADLQLEIPYGRSFPYSLGTAAAAAIIAFEAQRQRRAKR